MSTFVAERIIRSHTIHLPASPDRVFPLFTPLGERHWEPDWNPTMLYPVSGEAQAGTVFTTQHADEPVKVWTISDYDPQRARISYVTVLPTSHLSSIDIRCEARDRQATSVTVTYTFTSLTPLGATYLDSVTEDHYRAYIASWETAISHYLAHGRPVAHA